MLYNTLPDENMSLFKTSLVHHPSTPAVSLKERQQGTGTGLDHRQWVWGRRDWSFRHLHTSTAKHSQNSWILTARPPDSYSFQDCNNCNEPVMKSGPPFYFTSWQVERRRKLMSLLPSQFLLQGRTALDSTSHISKYRHKCSCATFLWSEKRMSCLEVSTDLLQ